jgi:hypothetical protein
MTITKERGTTEVLDRPTPPPISKKIERIPPQIEPPRKERKVRWLAWLAGVVLLVGLASVITVVLTTGDEVAETPGSDASLVTPTQPGFDPGQNMTSADLVTPTQPGFDPGQNS